MGTGVRRWLARLQDGWRYVCAHGVRATARSLFQHYVYRSHRFVVTRATLDGPPAASRVGDIVFRLATPSDLERLDELDRYGRGSRHRFYVEEDGDWLFVACHGERIVATRRLDRRRQHLVAADAVALGQRANPLRLVPANLFYERLRVSRDIPV